MRKQWKKFRVWDILELAWTFKKVNDKTITTTITKSWETLLNQKGTKETLQSNAVNE